MRHRVTIVHSHGLANGIESLNTTHVQAVPGSAREDRFTFPSKEYSHIRSFRIQIIKPYKHTQQTAPFAYDYQIGLHVYIVPRAVPEADERQNFYNQVNGLLHDLFGVNVTEKDWILSLNSLYYFSSEYLTPQGELAQKLPQKWDTLEYTFADGKLVLKSFQAVLDDLEVDAGLGDYTEVGIFGVEALTTRDDLVLSGARVIFNDEDSQNAPDGEKDPENDEQRFVHRTMFHVKPRHRQGSHVPIEYRPNGLHPIMRVSQQPEMPLDDDIRRCRLYIYYVFENSVFFDRYQAPDLLTTLVAYGTTDLELPEYSAPGWGTEALLELDRDAQYPLDLTLHSRYQLPSLESPYTNVTVTKPLLFYGCEIGSDAFLLKNSPFDNKAIHGGSFEKFFTEDTVFYQVLTPGTVSVTIPNAHGDGDKVKMVTLLVLIVGVMLILSLVFRRTSAVSATKKNQ